VALALGCALLPACSSDDSGGDDSSPAAAAATEDLSAEEQEIVDAAQAWIDDEAEIDDDLKDQLQFTDLAASPNVTNVTFTQFIDDHRVVQGELVVHVLEDGSVQGASNALVASEPADEDVDPIDQSEAEENASKAVEGTPDEIGPTELVWAPSGSELVLAYAVDVTTTAPEGSFRVLVNAATGRVIATADAMTDRGVPAQYAPWSHRRPALTVLPATARVAQDADVCDPGPAPSACVFLPDPIYANGGDPPEVEDANSVLTGVELEGLDSDDGHLVGEYVDTEGAPTDVEPTVESDGTWAAGRARPGFEAAMAYYWVDTAHRLMDDLGFGDVWETPIPVEPVDSETVDNAFWDGQAIHLGVGSDGINEGEDASGIVHEYGHAVLDFQNQALFDSPEGGAYHEGFGDLLAFLVTLDDRTGDVGCLFPWTESLECLRRLDTDLVYPDDLVNEVHADGMIYTGAIWDIFEGLLDAEGLTIEDCPGTTDCDEVRDRLLTTLLTSHGYLVSGTTLPDVAAAFEQANDAVTGGEDADLIDAAFADHGLTGGGGDTMDPDGGFEPGEGVPSVQFQIAHSYRGDLDVVVGVADADGNDLCEPVSIHESDPNDAEDNLTGVVDLSDSDCGELMPPSEDQVWYLKAVDALAQDTGEIDVFTVYDGTDPYDAPGLPLPIADADPEGTTVFVDGSGEGPDTTDLPDDSSGDGPSFDIEVTHSYVGDLSIRAGTADNEGGNVLCSVDVLAPDSSNTGDGGLSGNIDMSDCADQYPPSDDTRWFVQVIDTAAIDEGTVDSLTLNGPDGESIEFTGLPADIPDDDPHGLVLLTDGERAEPTSSAGGGAPEVQIDIEHPYAGDLSVEVGAVDANDNVLCQVALATPDQSNSTADLQLDEALDDCASAYPPADDVRFYLFLADTLAQDEGRLVSATMTGPDGQTYQTETGTIPDADPDGVTTFFQPV
jgi:subtilisin-like proprotein convertase family protein